MSTTVNQTADAIPWNGFNMSPVPFNNDAGIMEMRWEANKLKLELWQQLAGRVPKVEGDDVFLVRENPTVKPPMNDEGASSCIQVVMGYVNPVVSLSNISDEEANSLASNALKSLAAALVLKGDEWEIRSDADRKLIFESVKPIIFCQIKRSVGGHESKQSRTTTNEIKQDSTQTNKTSGGLFGSFGGK